MKKGRNFLKSLGLGLALLSGFVIYAYGFQVTQVDLEETQSPRRQEQLIRILRALARPHIIEFEQDTRAAITYVMLPLFMPDFRGLPEVDAFLRKTADREAGVFYINCSSSMQDKKFYYDHMHFNKTGIEYFLKTYIRPIL